MIWRHLFGYLPVNIVHGLVSFGTVFAYTRLLGDEGYGSYALVLTLMSASHTFTLTWTEASAYRFAGEAEAKGGMNDHIRTSLGLVGLSLIPALLIVACGWLFTGNNPTMQMAMIWLALSLPCMSIVKLSQEIHRARQQVSRYAIVSILNTLVSFALGLFFAAFTNAGASGPFIGFAIGGIIFAIIQGLYLLNLSKGGKFIKSRAENYFKYGIPLALALLLDIALSTGDRFLIAYFLDNAAVGAYAAGYGVADQSIRLLCMWGAMAGAPLLMEGFEKHGIAGVREPGRALVRMLILISFPAATGLALVAQPLADFMIGEELRDQAKLTIPWIAVAGLLNGLIIYYFSESFQLAKKTALRAILMLIPAVFNVILNIVLLPKIGLMGAVYSTVAAYAIAVIIMAIIGRKFVPLPIPYRAIGLTSLACLMMAAVVHILPSWGGLPELILKALVGGIVYIISAVALNAGGARDLVQQVTGRYSSETANEG